MLRRRLLTGIGTATTVGIAGCSGSGDAPSETENTSNDTDSGNSSTDEETATTHVVESGESIQRAIDESEPGAIVEVQSGTYDQSVLVDKRLTLVAPDGAVLTGTNAESESGITVAASSVQIDGFDIFEYTTGITTESDVSDVSVTGVESSDNSGPGLDLSADTISLDGVTLKDNGDTARLESSSNGEVTVRGSTFVRSVGNGLSITGGKTVEVDHIEALQNEGDGIRVSGGNVRDQTVKIASVTTLENEGGRGLVITGTNGADTVTVETVEAADNSGHGIEIIAETVDVTGAELRKNGPTTSGISVESSGDGAVTIRDSTVENTERDTSWSNDEYGRGIHIVGGKTVEVENVDLLQNGGNQLYVEGGAVRGQTVSVTNSTVIENSSGSGLTIGGTNGDDSVTITNVEATDNSYHGIDVAAETVDITGAELRKNGHTTSGLSVESSSNGTVTISDTVVEDTKRYTSWSNDQYGRGIHVVGGKTVEIENVELLRNGGYQLYVEGGDVRGQTVTVSDSTLTENTSGSGISLPGTSGVDEQTITNTVSKDHASYGFRLGAETVVIEDTSASGNGEGPLELLTIDESEATIRNSF